MRGSSSHVDLPRDIPLDPYTVEILNDRLRRLATATSGGAVASTSTATSSSAGGLLLAVPGTLAIRSSVTPLVSLPTSRTVTQLRALLKRAPAGGNVSLRLYADGEAVTSVTIGEGQTSGSVEVSRAIAPGSILTLDVVAVGYTFPGADLSVLISV